MRQARRFRFGQSSLTGDYLDFDFRLQRQRGDGERGARWIRRDKYLAYTSFISANRVISMR
jgi:hypothetical protein